MEKLNKRRARDYCYILQEVIDLPAEANGGDGTIASRAYERDHLLEVDYLAHPLSVSDLASKIEHHIWKGNTGSMVLG